MATHYFYLDETGTVDLDAEGGSKYFGIGTAHYVGNHQGAIWAGHHLRIQIETRGTQLPSGLHAKNDSYVIRNLMYETISKFPWSFDSTFLLKSKVPLFLRHGSKLEIYYLAVFLHLDELRRKYILAEDEVVFIAGAIGISSHRKALRKAIDNVFRNSPTKVKLTLCVWQSSTAFGIQVADYFLWRVQRDLEGRQIPAVARRIDSQIKAPNFPWK